MYYVKERNSFEEFGTKYFSVGKQKRIKMTWNSKHIKNLQRVTHVQSAIVQTCKKHFTYT